jgi:hypothetical protein
MTNYDKVVHADILESENLRGLARGSVRQRAAI